MVRSAFRSYDYQKRLFINRFWQVRDPFPDTPENEFRDAWERRVELAHERFEPGDLLGICTGAAVRPAATSPAVEVASLSTRLVLRPEPPGLIDGAHTWTIPDLRPLVPAAHANDGPVSGWIERSDGTTIEILKP